MELRPYQAEAVDAVFREWGEGRRRTLVVMATGCGKTVVFAKVAERVAQRGGRVLVLAHRGELLDQAADKIAGATGLSCSVERAEETSVGTWARVTVGSVQTLCRPERLARLEPDRFSAIVVDEAHHALSDSYARVLDHFGGARVLGVTATADRADRRSLGERFDSVAYEYGMARAVRDGWLCPIQAQTVPLGIDISQVSTAGGDWATGQLGDALDPWLEAIADHVAEACAGRKTVCFLPLVRTAERLRDLLRERGMDATEVDGASAGRSEALRRFDAAGPGSVLCNSMLLTEGWDCPSVDCVCVLRPTRSRALYVQMVGRGTRLSPGTGKDHLLLLDFLWMTGRHELCRPACLAAGSPEVAARMTEANEDGRARDVLELAEAAERDVQAEREERLAAELARCRRRRARLVDPLQYEMSICAEDLSSYEPTFAWESEEATEGQASALEAWGIDPTGMCCGKASMVLDRLSKRKAEGMATPKQIRMLERKGFRHPGTWTKEQAGAMMARLARNRWTVPAGVDPASYEPGRP